MKQGEERFQNLSCWHHIVALMMRFLTTVSDPPSQQVAA